MYLVNMFFNYSGCLAPCFRPLLPPCSCPNSCNCTNTCCVSFNLFLWTVFIAWLYRLLPQPLQWMIPFFLTLACFLKFTASLLAKIFAASFFWNAMCMAHAFVSRILDRPHLPQKTSGFPTSPPLTVAYCFGGCNYIFLHSAAEPDVLSPISLFPRR